MNHYDWLDENFPSFLAKLGVDFNTRCPGIISCHGDKCYSYRRDWEEVGIPFEHGVALYILTYLKPWDEECRSTSKGWIPPKVWVIKNYNRFKDFLKQGDLRGGE